MFTRTFHPDLFLRSVYGTEPFVDYCRRRGIAFEQNRSSYPDDAPARWTAALNALASERQARVEWELAMVNEMSGRAAAARLLELAEGRAVPRDLVPGGAPLVLWFLLRHPDLFREAFFQHQVDEVEAWRTARAPAGLDLRDLDRRVEALRQPLREFFAAREGTGRFCAVEGRRLGEAIGFVAHVADRLHFLQTFTDAGHPHRQRLRPARQVLFVYYPADGTVLFKSGLRSRERNAELLDRFGRAVLGVLAVLCDEAFRLEAFLQQPLRLLPDRNDMEAVRVKALHLRYAEREGRRVLKLETRAGDDAGAIDRLLKTHVDPELRPRLEVCHAEIQVRLRYDDRCKTFTIRLWPDRCTVPQTALGDRFRACLRRWGVFHE